MCKDRNDREEDIDKGEREERRNGDMNDNIDEQKSDVSQGVEERQGTEEGLRVRRKKIYWRTRMEAIQV